MVYNGEEVLRPTIESILHQTYSKIEYVVIDGASKDGTMAILQEYSSQIDILISEPDEGIYDAMNKGLNAANGDYVLFMNAGDRIASNHTIEKVMALGDADIFYGETLLIDENEQHLGLRSDLTSRKLPKKLTWKSLKRGLVVSHQSIIVKKDICPFYIDNNLSADIDWVIKSLKKSQKTMLYNGVISHFLVGGISDQKKLTSLKHRFLVMGKHFGWLSTIWLHFLIIIRWFVRRPQIN